MRLTTWNIRSGGGMRIPAIAEALRATSSDLVALTEYRTRPGAALKAALGVDNSSNFVESTPPVNQNGVIVISARAPLTSKPAFDRRARSDHRWLEVVHASTGINALCVHIPNKGEIWDKPDFWRAVLAYAEAHLNSTTVILGDFNTGLAIDGEGEAMSHMNDFQRLLDLGWVDAWRHIHGDRREYTWYSPNKGNGFRLDYCFVAPPLACLIKDAWFNHDVRAEGTSDHSLLTVELLL